MKERITEILADNHIQFERIHPFSNGNGRSVRMLLMYLNMLYDFLPIVINSNRQAEYIRYLTEEDIKKIINFISRIDEL
ncbi:MAG: Fic family protein [Streptococcaceae bacterium]|nr:Fic family protein [Streptococcaceae bacterium]